MTRANLPAPIRALLSPAAYPHPADRVELIQTHISYVFLAGEYAYKVKKPVDFGFLDFSSLAKRRYYCRQEVILNGRLCAGTYLGVSRVVERDGRYALEGRGRVVEYAVRMRRLPAERMMDRVLARGELTGEMLAALARRLAQFHSAAETSPRIAQYGHWAIRYAWQENFRQWAPSIGKTLTEEQDRILRAFGQAFFARRRELMAQRVDELRIRDCHGDLRTDAVCFVDGVCIFDCIEFNRRVRYTDVAADVGFLAMDLDYRRRPDLADAFVRSYTEASADHGLAAVIDFYKCYRACVRGKVEGFRMNDPLVSARDRRTAGPAARRYFDLACRYAASLPPRLLIITCGLVATGKSTLAGHLARTMGLELVSSDVVRKELAGLKPSEHRFEPFARGIYSPQFTDRTYAALLQAARHALRRGQSVIVDASFARSNHRKAFARLAQQEGAQFACIECRASEATVRRRLARRLAQGADPSDARWEIYTVQKRRFQPVDEVSPDRHIALDLTGRIDAQARKAARALKRLSPSSFLDISTTTD